MRLCLVAVFVAAFGAVLLIGGAPAVAEDATQESESVAHGRYLVHSVAMCVQCHSPRNRQGELLQDRLLTGGSVPVESPYTGKRWAFHAPNLRNLSGYTRDQFVQFMVTGKRPDGTEPRAPMPPFRMTPDDAGSVYDYLTSP